MVVDADLRPARPDEQALSPNRHAAYRRKLVELLYHAVSSRPNIMFTVSVLARSLHVPAERDEVMAKRVLRYLSQSRSYGLFFTARPSYYGINAM